MTSVRYALKSLVMMSLCFIYVNSDGDDDRDHARIPSDSSNTWTKQTQMAYLSKYGYMAETLAGPGMDKHVYTDEQFTKAIKDFQKLWKLKVTGVIDEETEEMMNKPRCGNSDLTLMNTFNARSRTKRYVTLLGGGWSKHHLTYRIQNIPNNLNWNEVIDAITRAFDEWAKVTILTFDRVESTPDIDILFAYYSHGDGVPFDGPKGELAHTFFPIYGGDTHFDASETWTLNVATGTDLFQVAVHEFGHALGLGHSWQYSAVMYPYYSYNYNWHLTSDDINGILSLYDPPSESPTPVPQTIKTSSDSDFHPDPTETPSGSDFCAITSIDAITSDIYGYVYVFKGDYIAVLDYVGIAPGYPVLISQALPDLPSNLDAALKLPNLYQTHCWYWGGWYYTCSRSLLESGRTYFFKDNTYYLYIDGFEESGLISSKFPGMPSYIDAAFSHDGTSISFIKGSEVWLMMRNSGGVDSSYPKPLSSVITGLPSSIDGVFKMDYPYYILHYFFSGSQYYRVSGGGSTVDLASPPYPRPFNTWWFNCEANLGLKSASLHRLSEWGKTNQTKPQLDEVYMDENGEILHLNTSDIIWVDDDEAEGHFQSNSAVNTYCYFVIMKYIGLIYYIML